MLVLLLYQRHVAFYVVPFTSIHLCTLSPFGQCVDCFFCELPGETCCLKEHEDVIQEALEIYGDTFWNCRLSILHYSECGRCMPDAHLYADPDSVKHFMNFTAEYIANTGMPLGFNQLTGVKLCRQACENLYTQCIDATTIPGVPIIPKGVSMDQYCAGAPLASTKETPCFNSADRLHGVQSAARSVVMTLLMVLLMSILVL